MTKSASVTPIFFTPGFLVLLHRQTVCNQNRNESSIFGIMDNATNNASKHPLAASTLDGRRE
jgi:hypothetical protein